MSELWRDDDKGLLRESKYICCLKRRNHPWINLLVCEQCRYNKKCASYQAFKEGITLESYFNKLKIDRVARKKRKKHKYKRNKK
jgi:hypothetical protein